MYQRLLVPTDGSDASRRAIQAGVAFAREVGADIIGLTVTEPFRLVSGEGVMLQDTPDDFEAASDARARTLLADVDAAARAAGVPCRLEHVAADAPHEAIVETARRLGCDLIVMGSHGRKGLKALLLGSETQKVLVHADVPVLVQR